MKEKEWRISCYKKKWQEEKNIVFRKMKMTVYRPGKKSRKKDRKKSWYLKKKKKIDISKRQNSNERK